MKKSLIYFFSILLLNIGCKKEQDFLPENSTPIDIVVDKCDRINIEGNIFLQISIEPVDNTEIKINGSSKDKSKITVEEVNGELTLRAKDDVTISDNILVELVMSDFKFLKLRENDQVVLEFLSRVSLRELEIVTESNSNLEIYNLRAESLKLKQEDNSKIHISSPINQVTTPAYFSNSKLLDEKTLLVDNFFVVQGDSISKADSLGNKSFVVYGVAYEYVRTETLNSKMEGRSTFTSLEIPVKNINIQMEGKSNAKVWATNILNGKGEGNSQIFYAGSPKISYKTEGAALISKVDSFN